jgi:hypothetical protein
VLSAFVATALAETVRVAPWPTERVWPAAVRFLRVDLKLTIVEKDSDAGYVLFELVDDGKVFPGSLELSRRKDGEGREATRVVMKIPGRPAYVEDRLLEKLDRKLKEELGAPAPPPKPPADEADDSGGGHGKGKAPDAGPR